MSKEHILARQYTTLLNSSGSSEVELLKNIIRGTFSGPGLSSLFYTADRFKSGRKSDRLIFFKRPSKETEIWDGSTMTNIGECFFKAASKLSESKILMDDVIMTTDIAFKILCHLRVGVPPTFKWDELFKQTLSDSLISVFRGAAEVISRNGYEDPYYVVNSDRAYLIGMILGSAWREFGSAFPQNAQYGLAELIHRRSRQGYQVASDREEILADLNPAIIEVRGGITGNRL